MIIGKWLCDLFCVVLRILCRSISEGNSISKISNKINLKKKRRQDDDSTIKILNRCTYIRVVQKKMEKVSPPNVTSEFFCLKQ